MSQYILIWVNLNLWLIYPSKLNSSVSNSSSNGHFKQNWMMSQLNSQSSLAPIVTPSRQTFRSSLWRGNKSGGVIRNAARTDRGLWCWRACLWTCRTLRWGWPQSSPRCRCTAPPVVQTTKSDQWIIAANAPDQSNRPMNLSLQRQLTKLRYGCTAL